MPADHVAAPLARLTARPTRTVIGPGPAPGAVIAALTDHDHSVVLQGRWFDGDVLIMTDPVREIGGLDAELVWPYLDDQPQIVVGDHADVLGGGWAFVAGYTPGTSWVGFYDSVLRCQDGSWSIESLGLPGRDHEIAAQWRALLDRADAGRPSYVISDFSLDADADGAEADHLAAVEMAIGQIDRGDFYQVNVCTRLHARISGSKAALFADAAARLDPDYGALITTGPERAVISFSPELFLESRDGRVRTAPIKGTSSLAEDPDGNRLARSAKDAAENVMITDLMRNDLSRVCRPGTVAVPDLLRVERHAGVWQLVSTVTGQLQDHVGHGSLMAATFPPGSVTGAPKSSAVHAIRELEAHSRGAYTGALGLAIPGRGLTASVIIRTFEVDGADIELGVGGGITVDSVPISEWRECLHKARPLTDAVGSRLEPGLETPPASVPEELRAAGLIETVLLIDGRPQRWPAHLARLDRACRELYDSPAPAELTDNVVQQAIDGRAAARVTVRPTAGGLRADVRTWSLSAPLSSCELRAADRAAVSWRFKWADRSVLEEAEQLTTPALPYFVSPGGWVTESSRGNVFMVDEDGTWVTPPADDHLLPGVTRRDLLDALGDLAIPVRLRRFTADQLRRAEAAVWTSSLSGLVEITSVDDHLLNPVPRLAELRNRLGFTDGL